MLGIRCPSRVSLPRHWLLHGLLLVFFTPSLLVIEVQAGPLVLQCDPCLNRSRLEIHAIVHGTADDPSWQQTEKAMKQAAKDMGIQFHMNLNETFSSRDMADEILRLIRYKLDDSEHGHTHDVKQIDGLIVSIPDETVKAAVQDAIDAGIHVFGIGLGYQYAKELGILGYVAQDEFAAGQLAAREFDRRRLDSYGPARKALFVNHDENDPSLRGRFEGFNDSLSRLDVVVEQVFVNPNEESFMVVELHDIISTCEYDYVLLGGSETVEPVAAFANSECTTATSERRAPVMLGAFDGTKVVFDAIAEGSVEFALTQENYLQGALSVIFSTIYASTGKHLSPPFDQLIYSSGPHIVDLRDVPSEQYLACQAEAFPVCDRSGEVVQIGECTCINRSTHRIAGVVHGIHGDPVWETIIDAATQASLDMEIELEVELFEPELGAVVVHNEMANRIKDICSSGIDGIFVSIPSEIVKEAVRFCKQLRIPIVNINLGHQHARELGIQYVGQLDTVAGVLSGERMMLAGVQEGYCITSDSNHTDFAERCNGFQTALLQGGRKYGGVIEVPSVSQAEYNTIVESAIGDPEGNWDGIGLIVIGDIRPALHLQRSHQRVALGTFDVNENLYTPLDDGRLLFTIDQQPFLQGSMAVYLLAYTSLTEQILVNDAIETGPNLVQYSPHKEQLICEKSNYVVCPQIPEEDYNYIPDYWIMWGYIAFGVVSLGGLLCFGWTVIFGSNNVVLTSQSMFLNFLVCGSVVSMSAIFPKGAQAAYRYLQDPATGEITDELNPDVASVDFSCMLAPWLYGVGFSIMFTALCSKIHRLKAIQVAAGGMGGSPMELVDVMTTMATMLALEATVLVSWSLASPSQWERIPTEFEDGYVRESIGQCSSDHHDSFVLAQLIFHTACLFYATLLSWQASEVPSEFSEGSYIFLSVLVMFQVLALSIPISYLFEDTPGVYFLFWATFLFLQTFPVLCFIFLPKIFLVATGNDMLPPPRSERINWSGEYALNIQSQQSNSAAVPTVASRKPTSTDHSSDQSSAAPPPRNLSIDESLRYNTHASRFNYAANQPKITSNEFSRKNDKVLQESAPVARMESFDSEDEAEAKAIGAATVEDARKQLKAGLHSDGSSSSSSLSSLPEDSQNGGSDSELAGLASEIAKAAQSRDSLYSSENVDEQLQTAMKPKSPVYTDSKDKPRLRNPPKEKLKRQNSPDADDSFSSTSDESYYVPKGSLVLSKMPRRNQSQEANMFIGGGDANEDKLRPAMIAHPNQEDQINPQEGSQGSLELGKNNNKTQFSETDHINQDGSTGVLDADTKGISGSEASKAQIFREPALPDHIHTPIRLKKQADAYGENAMLAMGITKASGSFLRKVAASFGSATFGSSTQQWASVGSKSTCLDTPAIGKNLSHDAKEAFGSILTADTTSELHIISSTEDGEMEVKKPKRTVEDKIFFL